MKTLYQWQPFGILAAAVIVGIDMVSSKAIDANANRIPTKNIGFKRIVLYVAGQ